MKKLGLILAATLISGASLSAPSLAQEGTHQSRAKIVHNTLYWHKQAGYEDSRYFDPAKPSAEAARYWLGQ